MLFLLSFLILIYFLLVEVSPLILRHPHVAQLHQRPEDPSLQLVDEVVHFVRTLDEPGLVSFDAQLHLDHDFVSVENVDEDVLCHP